MCRSVGGTIGSQQWRQCNTEEAPPAQPDKPSECPANPCQPCQPLQMGIQGANINLNAVLYKKRAAALPGTAGGGLSAGAIAGALRAAATDAPAVHHARGPSLPAALLPIVCAASQRACLWSCRHCGGSRLCCRAAAGSRRLAGAAAAEARRAANLSRAQGELAAGGSAGCW